ncbi:hypothetical protein [Engelhardtia mirabilis]|uniref:Uncharacterized protein n=1 Tax=Engelhardtia mirabilis TaxID=2528011 RepID=A0A518BL11_9BACT|nr:hypothetical protein Pla133_27470 [Planctomycetes bacterium Pla133]QDV01985.1 hypothetical protein Pla86_27460 [Planctomycetes bacterium Pla86]
MKRAEHVAKTLAFLGECYPGLRNGGPAQLAAWSAILGSYSLAQLLEAAEAVARTHTYGIPAPAHLVEAIEGRLVWSQVPYRDIWGSLRVDGNGRRVTEAKLVRRFPDGREEPADDALDDERPMLPPGAKTAGMLAAELAGGDS